MKTTLKKTLSFLLCFVLLAGIVPAGLLPGSGNAVTAEAAGVSGYSAGAAAQWAIDHLDEYDSVLLGQNYWYTGGDCANFVSHCLYMGGMDMNGYWNISGYMCHWAQPYGDTYAGSFIRCQQLYNYLVKMGAQVIRNPSASQVSIGDVLLYSAEGASRMTHSAIVIDIKNGTPVVAAHSVDGIKYRSDRDNKEWHLGFRSDRTYLMKLYGATCVNQKARTFDVYIAHSGDLKLYASANASSGYHTTFLSGEYAHVYSTVNAGGYTWGYTFRYGAWGWIKLSGFSYQRHINAVQVSHKFGAWKTVRKATCLQDGLEQRVCSRCGYTEDRTTTCGHVTLVHATCTTPGYCSVCGMQTEDALGHNFEIDNARYIEPTCTEDGFGAYTCTRCGAHDDHTLPALGHDYVAMPTAPTCVQDGISTLVCSRCSDTLVVYTDEDNTWSEWTETTPAEMGLGGDRVQSKTQYRSSDYETQTSYATSISGWTRGDFTLVKSSSGSIDYGTSWPAGFNTSHSLYSQYHKSKTSASETETSKRVINSDNVLGYIYWHWCRGLTDGPTNHIIYGEKHANDKGEKWYTFHAFYSTTDYELRTFPGTGHGDAYVASRSDVCIDSYYWGRINVNKQSYTDYKKLYTYSRWTDYSAWQDAEITATDTERVQTRTLYRYDLAALGHDFSTTTEKQFLTQPHLLSSDELNGDCYAIGTVCSRCGAVAPDSTVFPHDVPVFETEPEAYALITAETDPVQVYRTYCRCGCGCWYDVSVNTCEWTETVIAPTCTEVGYTLHTCTAHGETFTTDEIPALGHDMSGEWVITKNPTCTEAGEMECLCARYDVCGHKETQEIPPLWHTMTAFEAKEPTCTEDGESAHYYCAVCDTYFADENGETEIAEDSWILPALGHNDGVWRVIEEPGCGKTGYEGRYCTREHDGEVCDCLLEEREIPALEPDYYVSRAIHAAQNDNGEWVADSCGVYAYIIWTCRVCGDSYPEVLDPAEHTPGGWIADEEASCVHAGHRHKDCTVCGERLEDEIVEAPRTAHNYVIAETVNSACSAGTPLKHYVCSICGETECEACAAAGTPHHYWDGDPQEHSIVINSETAPTCTEAGLKTYGCENCDYSYTETIDALGHDWALAEHVDATCTEQGYDLYRCGRDGCGAEEKRYTDPALGHDHGGEYTVLIEATCTEPGEKALYCVRENNGAVCGALLEKKEIPPTGHDWGDWTANADGTHTRICANDASHVETAAHDWDDGIVTKQPTTTEEGEITYHCLVCAAIAVYPIPVLPDDEDHEIKTEKTAEYDADTGEATIRLKASAADEVIEAKTVGGAPLDIVLVIDQSGSMAGSRVEALNRAATAFAEMVQQDAKKKGVDHRMAVVGFAMGIYSQSGYPAYANTEIRTVSGSPVGYSKNLKAGVYKNALVSVNKDGTINPVVAKAVSSFKSNGATAADVGLSMANNIFANNPLTGNRERIVVFMTDGEPNHKTGFDEAVANAAIQQAYQLKHTYGAAVYSIGVECGSGSNIVKFLNSVSSNYPDAVSMSARGAETDSKYNISVGNATAELAGVFRDIAVSSVAGKAMFSDVTLTDTVSEHFTLTAQQESRLRKDAVSKLGVANADVSVTRKTDGTTQIVIRHIEPETVGGRRVIDFSFTVSANENTLQKGLYKTNTENAGISLGDGVEFEETFISPVVKLNEARNAAVFTVNGDVYHILSLQNGEPVAAPAYEVASGYTFSGWNVPEDTVVDGGSAVFDAQLEGTAYTVTWKLPGETKTVSYYPGQIIAVPTTGSTLVCDPQVPVVMPAENLIFTLTAAEHEHAYLRYIVKSPTCTESGTAEYICTVCGDSYEEPLTALGGEHHWVAIVGATDMNFTGYEDFRCDICGAYMGNRLQYKTASGFENSYSGVATVQYEMSMTNITTGAAAQPQAPVDIVITPPASMANAKKINVYRKDASGNTLLTSDFRNGILRFSTEHFCLFIFEAFYSCEEEGAEHPDKNRDGICDLCGFEIPRDRNDSGFRCKMCFVYELMKDVPVIGTFYTLIHFFVHLAHYIGYLT